MYYTQEQIDRANQADLVSFLQSQGEQLTRAGNEYRWKRHDSLTVRGNKWYRHSQSKGGAPIDFVMEFFGKSFTEAVELLTGEKGAAPPPDRPSPTPFSDFRLPPRSPDNCIARNYLTAARRIDEDVSGYFFATGDIYEEAAHHNAVFVGRDKDGVPRYAHQRSTAGNLRLDVKGSDKAFNFCYRGEGERLFVFEAPIDLLSFLCLFKKDWQKQSYLALGGVGDKALMRFLSDRPNIKTVYLCLDSDKAGNDACSRLVKLMPEGYTVHRLIPLFKDWNEVLQHRAEITDGKYIREAVYGLKEPPQEETVEIIRMSEVDTQTVEWLWEPYIPFGKVTIVQGNPGEGKTTFALRLAAACTTGGTLPGMKPIQPFQVIYQTAEDGLGDTVKPRLIRSREVSLCLLYQQLAQCKAIYDKHAETILGNMDSVVFLGGREASTIKEISENWLGKATISMQTDSRSRGQSESYSQNTQRLGRELMTPAELATMPGDKCILQLRGLPPFFSPKYDLKRHPNYRYTAEADKQKNAFDLDRLINRRRRPGLNEACTMYEVTVPDDALTEEDEDILNYDDIDDPDAFA